MTRVTYNHRHRHKSASQPIHGKHCPLSNIDIFIVAKESEFQFLQYLMTSIEKFVPCYGQIQLLLDDVDVHKVYAWVNVKKMNVRIHRMPQPASLSHVEGYIMQDYAMLIADEYVSASAEYVMYLDTDSVFTLPLTCASLFDRGNKVYQLAWPIRYQKKFKDCCKILIPESECQRSYMST